MAPVAVQPESRSDEREDAVAGRVAEAVVDALEVVDVEEAQRDEHVLVVCVRELALQPLVEMAVVAEPGQRVGEGEAHRAERPVRRALVERDRHERAGERGKEERRPLPEHDEHQRSRRHQGERKNCPPDVRADQARVARLRPGRGDRGRDEQQVDGVEDCGGRRHLAEDRLGVVALHEGECEAGDPADEAEDAGIEDRADGRVSARQRDERRSDHVDAGRGRPAEEHEGRNGEDEPEGDAVRVGVLHRHGKALGKGGGDEERGDPRDRCQRPGVATERKRRGNERRDADQGNGRDDREESRGR